MFDGMWSATEGMLAMQQQQDIISNNLANAGTAGFRKEVMDVECFNQILNEQMKEKGPVNRPGRGTGGFLQATGSMINNCKLYTSTRTNYSQGSLNLTSNKFDMALDDNGKGFFTVQTPDGIKFTRNGSFRLSTDGCLVTQDGSKVLGQKGPIKVEGTDFKVNDQGVVMDGEKEIDKFLITEFVDKSNLQKHGEGMFQASSGFRVSKEFSVKQGYLEMGNLNTVQEMVDMMSTMKAFEANQKVLQAEDQAIRKTINEVGKTQ
jgi:flagellar basal-body rod protein FlgF